MIAKRNWRKNEINIKIKFSLTFLYEFGSYFRYIKLFSRHDSHIILYVPHTCEVAAESYFYILRHWMITPPCAIPRYSLIAQQCYALALLPKRNQVKLICQIFCFFFSLSLVIFFYLAVKYYHCD